MIFAPNESSHRNLFFEKASNGRNEQKYFKKNLEKISKMFQKIFNYFSYSGGGLIIARLGYGMGRLDK